MRRRVHPRSRRMRAGERQCVADFAPLHDLVVPREPREDGQPRGRRAGPAIRAQLAGPQIEYRSPDRVVPAAIPVGVVRLVEQARVAIECDGVPIAGCARTTLHGDVRRKWVWTRIALAHVQERHRDARLRAGDDNVRNAVLRRRAEIRVQVAPRSPEDGQHRIRARVDRRSGNVAIPVVVQREHWASGERGAARHRCWSR